MSTGAPVIRVLCYRGPRAIGRLVVAIVIFAIDLGAWEWFLAHVREKILETIEPALADLDTSTAVTRVRPMIRIATARAHVAPSEMEKVALKKSEIDEMNLSEDGELTISIKPV